MPQIRRQKRISSSNSIYFSKTVMLDLLHRSFRQHHFWHSIWGQAVWVEAKNNLTITRTLAYREGQKSVIKILFRKFKSPEIRHFLGFKILKNRKGAIFRNTLIFIKIAVSTSNSQMYCYDNRYLLNADLSRHQLSFMSSGMVLRVKW